MARLFWVAITLCLILGFQNCAKSKTSAAPIAQQQDQASSLSQDAPVPDAEIPVEDVIDENGDIQASVPNSYFCSHDDDEDNDDANDYDDDDEDRKFRNSRLNGLIACVNKEALCVKLEDIKDRVKEITENWDYQNKSRKSLQDRLQSIRDRLDDQEFGFLGGCDS